MFNYKCWYQDDEGYIVQCLSCKKIQVSFGTCMLNITEVEYENLFEQIVTACELYANETISPNLKHIILHTAIATIKIILSTKELIAVHNMFEQADVERKTYQLLQLF
jgi:hypothetical protein